MLRPTSFTLSAWVRASQVQSASVLGKAFDAGSSDSNSYEIWVQNTAMIHFSTVDATDPHVWFAGFTAGTWYHVAGTFDAGTKRIYVDGIERMISSVALTSYDAEPFRIGCDRGGSAIQNFFAGDVDDVRLYGRALGASEIADLASSPP